MGQKFAAYDDQGKITAFYDSKDHPVPDGVQAIEITYDEWQDALATPGYTVSAGVLIPPAPPQPPSLDSIKTNATIKIDAEADDIRRAVLGARATEYQTAYDEAKAFKDAMYAGTVPLTVQAWVDAKAAGGTAWTSQQAADDILATAAQWLNAQYAIRAARLKAKEKARAASDAAALDAALDEWAQFVVSIKVELGINPP